MKLRSFTFALALLGAMACDTEDDNADTSTTSGTGDTGAASADSTSSGGDESTGAGSETGGGAVCPDDPRMTCTVPVDCEMWNCGAEASPFDAEGCLRAAMFCTTDADCTEGTCIFPPADECLDVITMCVDEGDECVCNAPGVCGGYCG